MYSICIHCNGYFFLRLSFVSPSAVDYLESLISELISYVKDSQLGENSFQAGISEFWKNCDHKLADPYGWNADFLAGSAKNQSCHCL